MPHNFSSCVGMILDRGGGAMVTMFFFGGWLSERGLGCYLRANRKQLKEIFSKKYNMSSCGHTILQWYRQV